jgi:hypothetical protein
MTGINMSTPAPSSKSIVEGIPAPILFYMELVTNLKSYVEEAVNEALEEEVKESSSNLVTREPQYEELVKDFDIKYSKKESAFEYKVKGKSGEVAKSLEYGPPARSLVRHEAIVGSKRLSSSINKKLDKLTQKGNIQ